MAYKKNYDNAVNPNQYIPQYEPNDQYANALRGMNKDGGAAEGTGGGTDWSAMVGQYFDQIQNRPKFSYDVNTDALYQAYKDMYTHQGRRAMEDTMGQAAGLTGGYGSSYGQAVGNQAYNEYLTKLNAEIPGLYDRARSAYDAETQDLYNMYNLALGQENQQYDREQHDKEYADQQAYQQWQMQQAEQGNAREIALMMIQMGKTPSAELLQQAGISAADAAALAQYYAGQLAGTGSGGGGGPYYQLTPGGDDTTDKAKDKGKPSDSSNYPQFPGPLNHAYNGKMDFTNESYGGSGYLPAGGQNVMNNLYQYAMQHGPEAAQTYWLNKIKGKYSNDGEIWKWLYQKMQGSSGGGGSNRPHAGKTSQSSK